METKQLKRLENAMIRNFLAFPCVTCGKKVGLKGGFIPTPRDRRPGGVRCGWCYRRYKKKYFPEAL